jgi:hypothetical protein
MAITKISAVDLSSGTAASISFTSIPQSFSNLWVVFSLRTDRAASVFNDDLMIRFNSDTASNYSAALGWGNGSAMQQAAYLTTTSIMGAALCDDADVAGVFCAGSFTVHDYTSTTTTKFVTSESAQEDSTSAGTHTGLCGIYSVTGAAISSIQMLPRIGTVFKQYSSATLYGITKG